MWLYLIVLAISALSLFVFLQEFRRRRSFEGKDICYLGNGSIRLIQNTILRRNFLTLIQNQYEEIKNSNNKIGVNYDFGQKNFVIIDPDLLKGVLVKDFDHFSDRRTFVAGKGDYLFSKMLFAMTGERWKRLRSKLSPTFTTGKIKRMFRLFDNSGKKFVKFLESEIQNAGNEEIELTEAYSKFTMDIIASAACGIDSQAFNQKEPSMFEKYGKTMQLTLGGKFIILIFALLLLPKKVSDALGLSFFEKEVSINSYLNLSALVFSCLIRNYI